MSAVKLSSSVMESRAPLDQLVAGSAAFLLLLGFVMVGSASLDVLVENWRKYAENRSIGKTADDMRSAFESVARE